MFVMRHVDRSKKDLTIVCCPAAHPLRAASCLQGWHHEQGAIMTWGPENQDALMLGDEISHQPQLSFLFCLCSGWYTQGKDLTCAFPRVFTGTWKVKFLLIVSYCETSVSHQTLVRPAAGWRAQLRWGCWVLVPRGCSCPRPSTPTSDSFRMIWIQQHWRMASFCTAFD